MNKWTAYAIAYNLNFPYNITWLQDVAKKWGLCIEHPFLPMQNSVAATSIANLILPLYPALSIASLTRSNPSAKLANRNKQTSVGEANMTKLWDYEDKTLNW